ncbi:MAG: serine hydrolase [Streptosporangiales bacterium]|nr:serine hydrolase [Streptosporangiales bacterium]
MSALDDLEPALAAAPGTVSVWHGGLTGPPRYTRLPEDTHYAASTMKAAVLVAAHRAAAAGDADLDAPVGVHADFASGDGETRFTAGEEEDGDDQAWARLGEDVPLRWLLRRMIVRSGNLATNLVIEHLGFDAVAEAWRACGARHSRVARLLGDAAADLRAKRNLVTAADLAAVMRAIATDAAATPAACAEMRELLEANEFNPDIPAGLPPGTRVAHKNGWVTGTRHDAALVTPDDAPPYVLVVCTTTELSDDDACALVARVATASWPDRLRAAQVS